MDIIEKIDRKTIDKYLSESGSRSDFGKAIDDAINYLGRAINEASKEGISELKKLQKTMDFLQKLQKKYKI